MGYKPSVFEQARFDYSPFGNIFTKGLDKDDQKEELFKRLENIKDKNEELLIAFSTANKLVRLLKIRFQLRPLACFDNFYRVSEKFKTMSLGFKYDQINDFYTFLNAFINTHEANTTKSKNRTDKTTEEKTERESRMKRKLRGRDGKTIMI